MWSTCKIAFFFIDDPFGRIEVIVRQRQVEACREQLQSGIPLLLNGVVRAERVDQLRCPRA